MIYLTSYKDGEKFFCKIEFSGDGLKVEGFGKTFWGTFILCFLKGLIFEIKLKTKKLFKNGKGIEDSSNRDVCTADKH